MLELVVHLSLYFVWHNIFGSKQQKQVMPNQLWKTTGLEN